MPLRVACLAAGLLAYLLARPAYSQAPLAQRFTRAQVLSDLRLFQDIQERANAGLYTHHPKAQLDSAFAAAQAQVADSMTVLAVYRLVAGVTDFAGSLHSDTVLPDAVTRALHQQVAFFPLPVKFLAGTVLLDYSRAALPVGTELLAINGVAIPQLTRPLGRYYTTDGYNQTGKLAGLSENFAQYFYLEYGPAATFEVEYRLPGSPTRQAQHFSAASYATLDQRYRYRHSAALDSAATPPGPYAYGFRVAGPAAVLTLRTFDIGDNAHSPAHQAYRRFLDSCFTVIRGMPAIRGVVVDVRGNGGGTDPNDLLTFSYLAQRPFRENKQAFVLFHAIPHARYLQTDHRGPRRWLEKRQLRRELQAEFALAPDGRYYQRAQANPLYQPSPLSTRKPVYLLIDGRVASAASLFSALVRGNTAAVVIGEETMGGYYGHTGHTPVAYRLPATGIVTRFSLVSLQQDVPARASQPPGHGVLPDYSVTQSPTDFIAGRDPQLALALKLLAERAAATGK
ncbi:MAG: S41 family peptidase [Janthinobacterium lividum]